MTPQDYFDVIIVGGSYSGLSAGLALGRSLKKVLIIDSGKPCNQQTPHSHNFLTQDGKTPKEISTLAKQQVKQYDTVTFLESLATNGRRTGDIFEIDTASGQGFKAKKLIFATGVKDMMPPLDGYAECWGISVLHCPYCHGYEVRNQKTGILGNGEYGFEFAGLIRNWTKDLTVFTNGPSTLTFDQWRKMESHQIKIVESEIAKLLHVDGRVQRIVFKDGSTSPVSALYARSAFQQHCDIPQALGCELTDEGYIQIDSQQRTTIPGVFACGDNTTRMRSVANAVAMGNIAGMMANKELVNQAFLSEDF